MTNRIPKDPWRNLKEFTEARIGLGRSGSSIPTREYLSFQLSHAKAKDALFHNFDISEYLEKISKTLYTDIIRLESQAPDLDTYLQRPDLGRKLSPQSKEKLSNLKTKKYFIAITNGLSSLAVENHSVSFLQHFYPSLLQKGIIKDAKDLALFYVDRGRVAITDEIGSALGADMGILIVGERPGLSSPDSLGAYLTYEPRIGKTDELRNCISNIRPAGLKPESASARLIYLVEESLQKKISGVHLKDRSIAEESGDKKQLNSNTNNAIPKVKLCGLRDPKIAVFSVSESADYLGINLSPVSKRKVSEEQAIHLAEVIRKANDTYSRDTKIVLLFYKNELEDALRIAGIIQPDLIQLLHNDPILSSHWDRFREKFSLLPAISAHQDLLDSELPILADEIPIIDTPAPDQGGGTGETFPWERVKNLNRKYLLAGGLNPENVERAVKELHPWGLDVASGIEDGSGNQSREKIRDFIRNAKR